MRRSVKGIIGAVALLSAVPANAVQDAASYKLKAKATFTGLIFNSSSSGSAFGTDDPLDGLPALFTFIYYQHAQAYAGSTDGKTFVSKYFESYYNPNGTKPLQTYVTINGITKQLTNNYFGFGKENDQENIDPNGNIFYQDGIHFGGYDAEFSEVGVEVYSKSQNLFNKLNMNEYVDISLDSSTFGEGTFSFFDGLGTGAMGKVAISNFTVSAVPEPATWIMTIMGFGAAGMMLRRKRSINVREAIA